MDKDKGRRISIKNMKKEAEKVRQSSWWRCGMSKGTFSGVKVTVFWVTYVLLGSLVFQYLETTKSTTETTMDHHYWARFKELAAGHKVVEELLQLKEELLEICSETHMNKTFELLEGAAGDEEKDRSNKTLFEQVEGHEAEASCGPALRIVSNLTQTETVSIVDAIYYTMTAVTTIGYGHIHPTNPTSRIFCVLYCMLGVPLTCILLAKSTDLLSSRMQRVYNTAKRRHRGMGNSLLFWVTTVYLSVGFLVFMLVPSVILTHLEPWTLEESLYLTFITLTTIGFGDFYPGYEDNVPYEEYRDLYKMCIVIWIMVALGYWFLLLNFLQKVMRKHVPRRIKKSLLVTKKFKKQSEFFQQLVSKYHHHHHQGLNHTTSTASSTTTRPSLALDIPTAPIDRVMSQQQVGQQQQKTVSGEDEDSGVVALMVEVADALTSDDTRRPSINVAVPGGRRESRPVPPITLAQLLDVKVAVRGEAIPSIRSFVATSPHPSTSTLHDLLKQRQPPKEPEVTLSLREVLTLFTLIKSVEDQVGDLDVDLGEMSTYSTPSSPLSTVTSCDQPDYLPLIRSNRNDGKDVVETEADDDEEDDEEEEEVMSDVENGKRNGKYM